VIDICDVGSSKVSQTIFVKSCIFMCCSSHLNVTSLSKKNKIIVWDFFLVCGVFFTCAILASLPSKFIKFYILFFAFPCCWVSRLAFFSLKSQTLILILLTRVQRKCNSLFYRKCICLFYNVIIFFTVEGSFREYFRRHCTMYLHNLSKISLKNYFSWGLKQVI